ncbi:MAG: hypothetical protein WA071_25370 [Undibacterium umbellatum]|uniref:hypothetical protein n=1 Tax=Undibacterium TaxID=401469 RepID=UPI0027317FFC|nr:hypothetical protein [Undibacterium sp.]MDP1977831.1 hypothetical protein [Undibacterium sp.]
MTEKNEASSLRRKLVPSGDAKKVTGFTHSAFKRLFTSVRSEREESFNEARERLGWTEDDIAGFLEYRKKETTIYALLTAVAFLFACGAPYSENPWSHLVTSLAVMLMIGTRWLVAHFRLTQVRHRALFSFAEYLGVLFPFLSESVKEISEGLSEKKVVDTSKRADESAKIVDLNKNHSNH